MYNITFGFLVEFIGAFVVWLFIRMQKESYLMKQQVPAITTTKHGAISQLLCWYL